MATLNIFVSFEFDKDENLRGSFYKQAESRTRHSLRDRSLGKAYETPQWQAKAKAAIRRCDAVIVLVGEDTHNAPGVKIEVDIAQSLRKPVLQVRPQKRNYRGVRDLEEPIPWKWKRIERWLDGLSSQRQRGLSPSGSSGKSSTD